MSKPSTSATNSSASKVREFWKSVSSNQLIPSKDAKTWEKSVASMGSVEELAEKLIQAGALTLFQCRMILRGKARSLSIGSYIVLDRIGAGGMGQVFKAYHRSMKREAAIKLLPPEMVNDEAAIQRFHREVQAAAQLSHPNIVMTFDAGTSRNVHYLVMEFVDGVDLSALVKQSGPMPYGTAVNCIIQAAEGLKYAHERGIIHRDIKPHNMLMNSEGVVKILDMGLARFDETAGEDSLTETGTIMGTLDYMSPEQALDTRSVDARTDVYSLGCTLFFLASGRPMFLEDGAMRKLLAHRETPPPRLQVGCPSAPASLDAVFQKMVAKDANQRFQSMGDVIAALEKTQVADTDPNLSLDLDDPELRAFLQHQKAGESSVSLPGSRGNTSVDGPPAPTIAMDPPRRQDAPLPTVSMTTPIDSSGSATTYQEANSKNATAPTVPLETRSIALNTKPEASSAQAERRAASSSLRRRASNKKHIPFLLFGVLGSAALIAVIALFVVPSRPAGKPATVLLIIDDPNAVGADVTIDGQYQLTIENLDEESFELVPSDQPRTLRVYRQGFKPFQEVVSLEKGKIQTLRVKLLTLGDDGEIKPPGPDERKVAEWSLKRGAVVGVTTIDGEMSWPKTPDEIPEADFYVNGIDFRTAPILVNGDLRRIENLERIRRLDLAADHMVQHGAIGDEALFSLTKLTTLHDLNLAGCNITGNGLKSLVRLKQLEVLNLYGCNIRDDDLASLASLKKLRSLNLQETLVTGSGLAHLVANKNLRELRFSGLSVDDSVAPWLNQFPRLENLVLYQTRVGEQTIRAVSELKSLSLLHIEGRAGSLQSQDWHCLKSLDLANLKDLALPRTDVDDQALGWLDKASSLEKLDLTSTKVTPAILEKIADQKRQGIVAISSPHIQKTDIEQLSLKNSERIIYSDFGEYGRFGKKVGEEAPTPAAVSD